MTEQFYQVLKGMSTADRAGLVSLIEMALSQQALRQHWVSGMTPALCPFKYCTYCAGFGCFSWTTMESHLCLFGYSLEYY